MISYRTIQCLRIIGLFLLFLGIMILPLLLARTLPARASENNPTSVFSALNKQYNIEALYVKNGLEHYAYMDLEEADENMRIIILEARKRIIEDTSWVSDEAEGWIIDRDGNIKEVLPKFHDIFPDDWEDVTQTP